MDYYGFYRKYLSIEELEKSYQNTNGRRQVKAFCPEHEDDKPSLGVDLENGQLHCFGCGYKGNAVTFARERGIQLPKELKTSTEAAKPAEDQVNTHQVPLDQVDSWVSALAENKEMRRFLREERGLSEDVIETFQLGWDGERITIPIRDQAGDCVNVRRYLPRSNGENKVISYAQGFGSVRLFPLNQIYQDPLIIAEGELDALKLISEGFHAVTTTGGAGTWKEEWNSLFKGKVVAICYDNDDAGRKGAERVAKSLRGCAKSVHIVDWTGQGLAKGEDVTDFFVKYGHSREGFEKLLQPRKGLVINKPLEIIGDGGLGDVVVEAKGADALLFKANMGRVINLTLRQMGGGKWNAVDITQGRLELEGCDISSQSLACVMIRNGADPRLRRNRIHDGKQSGVFICENGQGTLEDNEVFGNGYSGVAISTGGNPTIRRNRIYNDKQSGIVVYEDGQGMVEDNDIFDNGLRGVTIKDGGNPIVRRNRIRNNRSTGVYVHDGGEGTLEDNEISANRGAGVTITNGGQPAVRRNRITANGFEAVWVYRGGAGTFEDNDLRGNKRGAWDIADDCKENVKRARNQE